jgi:protein farnesyltransferase subunit beta
MWLQKRQMSCEGGFQGRTNKLVDACYSYLVGSTYTSLLEQGHIEGLSLSDGQSMYNVQKHARYILQACQSSYGGISDRPEK